MTYIPYTSGFADTGDIERQYEAPGALYEAKVLYAYYSQECYSGASFVIFEKNGQLYEVNASHCSCYGLEGQWSPEETSPASIYQRFFSTDYLPYWLREDREAEKALREFVEHGMNQGSAA